MGFEEKLYDKCKAELTYKIPSKIFGDPPTTKCVMTVIGKRVISVPIGRQDLIPADYEVIDKRVVVPAEFPAFLFTLRPDQQEIYDLVEDNCLINANVSWGKTFTGIAIASKLKQKTLVITHTVILRDQWVEEIEKTLGIKAGIIGGGEFDHDSIITVGNIQTLRKYTAELRDEFGTVILDEVHHAPAKIFDDTINAFRARYKIGLSATLKRKDFLHIVIPDFFSRTIYKPAATNQMKPEICMVQSDIPFSSNNMIPWANRVNELVDRPEYLQLVTGLAETYANKGHLVLVVADRIEFLDRCHNRHLDRSVLVTSQNKDRNDLHKELEVGNKDILYGSISIYKEGVSLPFLSCLILAAPTNNQPMLEQLIGRVLRKKIDKITPVVVDIVLKGATGRKQAKTRAGHYIENNYTVKYLELS